MSPRIIQNIIIKRSVFPSSFYTFSVGKSLILVCHENIYYKKNLILSCFPLASHKLSKFWVNVCVSANKMILLRNWIYIVSLLISLGFRLIYLDLIRIKLDAFCLRKFHVFWCLCSFKILHLFAFIKLLVIDCKYYFFSV